MRFSIRVKQIVGVTAIVGLAVVALSVLYATRLPTRGASSMQLVSSRGRSSIRPERRSMARSSQPPGAVKTRRPDGTPPGSLGADASTSSVVAAFGV